MSGNQFHQCPASKEFPYRADEGRKGALPPPPGRPPNVGALTARLRPYVEASEALGFSILWSAPGREADDAIGALAAGLVRVRGVNLMPNPHDMHKGLRPLRCSLNKTLKVKRYHRSLL